MQGTYKLVEINSDTPCALPETYYANKVAEKYFSQLYGLKLEECSDGAELAAPFIELLQQPKFTNSELVRIVFAADRCAPAARGNYRH